MATTTPSAALVRVAPVFTNTERLALAGFLAGYSGLTRQAYELDLRQFAGWCQQYQLRLFPARRADIECFARNLEARGRARATITRRLCTVAGFYRYAAGEELLDHSRAAHAGGLAWIMSPTPPAWTVTSSVRCWSPPGSARQPAMR
jgi:Phage integrase, N-terminal SAM-like domain